MGTMKAKIEALPNWMNDVMQGMCYWIGHRRSYYREHPLTEGALSAELCNLIASGIDGSLSCEVPYNKHISELK